MDDLATVLIAGMAAARVGVLIAVEDGPADVCLNLRAWAGKTFSATEVMEGALIDHWVVRGLHCPWCVGFWAALPLLLLLPVAPILIWWLAAAAILLLVQRHD